MADTAALKLRIDSTDAARATGDLEKLDQAGKSVEKTFQGTGQAVNRGIKPVAPALNSGRQALDQYGNSAKQTAMAMRQLPMQMTDIVTGLVSGQPAYMVAIQQGGQLRDMFGGVGNALRAVMTILTPARLAFLGIAGAIGGLVAAYAQGSRESDAFNRALIMTGNAAGTSRDELARMARSIDGVIGTQREAAAALAAMAGTGRIAASELERFATVAIRMERTVGQEVSKTAKAFADLAKDPVQASLRLNDELRHLTASTFEQIRALDEAGRTTDAARVAMDAYATAMESRTTEITSNLGAIERGWQAVKDLASDAIDAVRGIARPMGLDEQYEAARARLEGLQIQASRGGGGRTAQRLIEQQQATVDNLAEQIRLRNRLVGRREYENRIDQESIKAQQEKAKILAGTLTDQQKLTKELEAYRRANEAIAKAGGVLDPAKVAAEEAAIRAKYTKATQERQTAAQRLTQELSRTAATLREQLETEERLGPAARARAEFEAQIALLKEQRVLTADQKSLLANEATLRAQLEKNEALEKELGIREVIRKGEEQQARREMESASRRLVLEQRLTQMLESRRDQYSDQLSAFGQGDLAVSRIREQAAIRRDFERAMAQAAESATRDGTLGSDEYRAAVGRIRSALDTALADHERYYASLDEARGRFDLGVSRGLQTYLDEVRDVSGQAERLTVGTFRGMEDAFADFVTSGKLNFKSLMDFIVAESARALFRKAATGPLLGLLGGLFGAGNVGPTGASFASELADGVRPMATGGDTAANRLLLVGEKGPELFVPKVPGSIVPNDKIGTKAGGDNITVNVHVDARSDAAHVRQAAEAGARMALARALESRGRYGAFARG